MRLIGQERGGRARADADKSLRAERAAALARRGAAKAGPADGIPHLVCACGTERYGLPLSAVVQVLPMRPCTPVPGAVPALLGLIALSGRIVGVVDLARALGRPGAGSGAEAPAGHLVVVRGIHPLALAVDRVLGISWGAGSVAKALSDEVDPGSSSDDAATRADPDGLGNEAASGYAPAEVAGGNPDFVALDLPRLLRRALP